MDTSSWLSIGTVLTCFLTGVLLGRNTDTEILILCLMYFIVTILVHLIGFYIFGIKP